MSSWRLAVPSKGRLRDDVLDLLATAGYAVAGLRGRGSMVRAGDVEIIEMRPRDAATALAAGAVDAAFVATDIALEEGVDHLNRLPLGVARSTLVLAVRDDGTVAELADLTGRVVATHMPNITRRFLDDAGVEARVMAMGGSLEGLCASGLADAIVDNTETGTSLRQNNLCVLAAITDCEAELVHRGGAAALDELELRLRSALRARAHRYVMLHVPPSRIDDVAGVFSGLAAPTVLPLTGRDDLVAVHIVVGAAEFWDRLASLRALGATGIVALQPDALAP